MLGRLVCLVTLCAATHAIAATTGCMTAGRLQELADMSRRAAESKRRLPDSHLPAAYREGLRRVSAVAKLPKSPTLTLVPHQDGRGNASVTDDGRIYLASLLWNGPYPLEQDEAAALIAHEVAHLEAGDIRTGLCETLEAAAGEASSFREATRKVDARAHAGAPETLFALQRRSHERELRADTRAVQLLVKAGYRADAMGRMLAKVGAAAAGASGPWHPPMEVRLENIGQLEVARRLFSAGAP